MKYAVSACLVGINCKYNGKNSKNNKLLTFLKNQDYITICPEVVGGLPTPRACSEIQNNQVVNTDGKDVTKEFYLGAQKELERVIEAKVDLVLVQPRSPSCGCGKVYDGTFSNILIDGDGIFVKMCKNKGIDVQNCDDFLEKLK